VLTNLESFEPDHRVRDWDENTTFNSLHRTWLEYNCQAGRVSIAIRFSFTTWCR